VRIYQVTVSGPQLHWRAEVNTSTVLVYPDDPEKRLIPGEVYQLTVRAGDHNSDEEDVSGRGFTLLTAQEAQSVYAAEQKIVSLTANLPETASRLLLAQLYAERGLIADAIEQLRELAAMTHEPGVPQFLGELYVAIGLNSLAKEQFIQALTLAEQGKLVLSGRVPASCG
jgi:hypothetical protein